MSAPLDASPPGEARIALGLEYDGSSWAGWQKQVSAPGRTIQENLEAALSRIAGHPVRTIAAGRTDAGVHAIAQVVHFDSPAERPERAWIEGVNSCLPHGMRVRWMQPAGADFHARFSAVARRYCYLVCNTPTRPALFRQYVAWERLPLDAKRMQEEGACLQGEQDFSAFRAAACSARSPRRQVHFLRVERRGDMVLLDIQANAFLQRMVRNIAGALMAVGTGRRPPGWVRQLLAGRDRTAAEPTAPAGGLYLVAVGYPQVCNMPSSPPDHTPFSFWGMGLKGRSLI